MQLFLLKPNDSTIPMNLRNWMSLTDPNQAEQEEIRGALIEELIGRKSCGMSPYVEDGEIMFHRHWVYAIAAMP